jgi:hypothetical protein
MRPYIAAAVLALTSLTLFAAPSKQKQCKNSCDVSYHFCMMHAIGKLGKKQCSAMRSSCKHGCPATR